MDTLGSEEYLGNLMAEESKPLTKPQEEAATCLALGLSMAQAAENAGVTEQTVRRWMGVPGFLARRDSEAHNAFAGLFPKAVNVLEDLLKSDKDYIRLQTAQCIIGKFTQPAKVVEKATGVQVVVEFGVEKPPMPEDDTLPGDGAVVR